VFINWLLSQQSSEVRFYNNVDLNAVEMREPDDVFPGNGGRPVTIYSFEDRNLELAARAKWMDGRRPDLDFLVLRSPENLFASRIKSGLRSPFFLSGFSTPELTEKYFRFGLFPEAHFRRLGVKLVPVVYDLFVGSDSYREQIAQRASLSYKPIGLDRVDTRYCEGSSFAPGQKAAPAASEVVSRWREFESDPLFRKWMAEFLRLSKTDYWEHYGLSGDARQCSDITPRSHCWAMWRAARRFFVVNSVSILRNSRFVTWLRDTVGDRRMARMRKRRAR
jgi:hypothetical protein